MPRDCGLRQLVERRLDDHLVGVRLIFALPIDYAVDRRRYMLFSSQIPFTSFCRPRAMVVQPQILLGSMSGRIGF
jgi:hypothetical protein